MAVVTPDPDWGRGDLVAAFAIDFLRTAKKLHQPQKPIHNQKESSHILLAIATEKHQLSGAIMFNDC